MSWIARADLCGLIAAALTDSSLQGTYNATAPNPVSMREFCSGLGRALRRPSLLPVPGAVLKSLLRDGAEVVLKGQKVLPKRLVFAPFKYQCADLASALLKVL